MNKTAGTTDDRPDTSVCRFTLGRTEVEVVACHAPPKDETQGRLACFEHAGVHYVVRELADATRRAGPLDDILTAREREIARLVAAGSRNKQIAYELRLSEYTVAAYIKHICYKLQVRNRTAMVTRCSQLGAAPPGELARHACRLGDPVGA